MYEPLKVFSYIGGLVFSVGLAGFIRFLYYFFEGEASKHLASLIASTMVTIVGFQILLIGLLADMISGNRKLLEDLLYRVRTLELTHEREDVPPALSAKSSRER